MARPGVSWASWAAPMLMLCGLLEWAALPWHAFLASKSSGAALEAASLEKQCAGALGAKLAGRCLRRSSGGRWTPERGQRVALNVLVRRTQKVKVAKIIAKTLKPENAKFESEPLAKVLRSAEKLLKKDEYVDELLSYGYDFPTAGDYIMPLERARAVLGEIYGEEPSISSFRARAQRMEEEEGEEFEDLEVLQELRKRPTPPAPGGEDSGSARVPLRGVIGGVVGEIGSVPPAYINPRGRARGMQGGSSSTEYTDVWLSGRTVSYNFDSAHAVTE